MNFNPADAQALRLLKAFFNLDDQEAREAIIALAESAERGASMTAAGIDGSAISESGSV